MAACFGSNGRGGLDERAAALTAGTGLPRRRAAGSSPEMAIGVLRGSIWVVVWPRSTAPAWVVH